MSNSTMQDAADWEAVAQYWQQIEPRTAPVSTAVVDRLGPLAPGALVLDLGCGVGEPGMSVLAANPGARLLGIDSAPAMVSAARARAGRDGVENAQFKVMDMAALTLETGSVDALVSRFGFLSLQDSTAEAVRVLRPGGPFAVAVWDRLDHHFLLGAVVRAVARQTGPDPFPLFSAVDALAVGGAQEAWLRRAGMSRVDSALFRWTAELPDAASVAAQLNDHPFGVVYSTLSLQARDAVLDDVLTELAPYATASGGFAVPAACRILCGVR